MTTHTQPPKWSAKLIERFAPEHLAEEIQGDLYEMFVDDTKHFNVSRARWIYSWRALGFLAKSFFLVTTNSTLL